MGGSPLFSLPDPVEQLLLYGQIATSSLQIPLLCLPAGEVLAHLDSGLKGPRREAET